MLRSIKRNFIEEVQKAVILCRYSIFIISPPSNPTSAWKLFAEFNFNFFPFLFFFFSNRKWFHLWLPNVVAYRIEESDEEWRPKISTWRYWMSVEESQGSIPPQDKQNWSQQHRANAIGRGRGWAGLLWGWVGGKECSFNAIKGKQLDVPGRVERSHRVAAVEGINWLRYELG